MSAFVFLRAEWWIDQAAYRAAQVRRAVKRAARQQRERRGTAHDRTWRAHPAVATDEQLTFGQRAADTMKAVFATWAALFGMLAFIFGWIGVVRLFQAPIDNPQLTILNLILSSLAGLQCFVLLIAAKRADQIAAAIALHTLQNTEAIKTLIEANTALTEQVAQLTREVHAHMTDSESVQTSATPRTRKRTVKAS